MRQGLAEANRKLDEFAKQTERTGNIIAGALSFDFLRDGLVSLAEFVKGGADAADAMGELAASVGVPVEELSKLAYAATFSGTSTEAVGKALAKTAGLMAKALDPASEQAAAFQALGISATDADGRLRATADVFGDIAQRFAETDDGAGKTALAIRLFGEEGAKLVPLLNNGKAGLAAFGAEAERTGNVITEKGAASAGQFNDALDRLKKAGEGLALRVAQDLAPNMASLADEFTTGKGSAEAFETAATALAGTIRVLASAGILAGSAFELAGNVLAGYSSAIVNAAQGDFRAAQESIVAGGKKQETLLAESSKRLSAIWGTSGPGAAMAKDAEKAKPSADAYVSAMERTKAAAAHAAEAQKKLAEEARKAAEASGKALDEYAKSALALERQHGAIDREVAKRRAAADGATPTDGFSGLDDALSRMAAAQKAAATMRDRAGTREKDGDILGADRATRKAAELEEFAARAGRAADMFADRAKAAAEALGASIRMVSEETTKRALAGLVEMQEAIRRVAGVTTQMALDAGQRQAEADAKRQAAGGELAGMLAPSGAALSATVQGVQTGAAAGPVGAVVGGLVGLLSQSEQFQGALESLESIFQTLANSVGALVEPLLPLLYVVEEVAAGLGALFEALSPIIEWVARPLFEVLKGFGLVVLGLVKLIGEIINGLGDLFGFKNSLDLSGIGEAMARLESATYDSAKAQQGVADAARDMEDTGALNVPSWWKVEAARFAATDPSERGSAGGGSPVVNDNSVTTINVTGIDDPEAVAEMVLDRIEEKKKRDSGSKF